MSKVEIMNIRVPIDLADAINARCPTGQRTKFILDAIRSSLNSMPQQAAPALQSVNVPAPKADPVQTEPDVKPWEKIIVKPNFRT